MTRKKRLKNLEQAFKRQQGDSIIVVFRDVVNGKMAMPSLDFNGSLLEGEKILSKYKSDMYTIVYFNIPRPRFK